MQHLLYYLPVAGLLGLGYMLWKYLWVVGRPIDEARMGHIGRSIQKGARTFLFAEYKFLGLFVIPVSALLFLKGILETDSNGFVAVSFIVGASLSALAGLIGMQVATYANVRTAYAAQESLTRALSVSFAGGSVMGIGVVSLGILGLSGLLIVFEIIGTNWTLSTTLNVLSGFSLGASSIALFARVGGGIYTKAADVGADLVGKVEAGIPEDNPLNPATIADNVGDNVGDVAGMGADLFESFVGSILAAMVLGAVFVDSADVKAHLAIGPVLLPLAIGAAGILISIAGTFFVRVKEGGDPQKALNRGEFVSLGTMLVALFFIIYAMLPARWTVEIGNFVFTYTYLGVYWSAIVGLISGVLVGKITEYYTATHRLPTNELVDQSRTGYATNIISGLALGMKSTALPIVVISVGILLSYYFAGLYGIAIGAVGMLANTGIQLAIDAFGPIADNAGGIAEMSGMPHHVRERTDKLDAVGNTTAAIGKGFAIASAALTTLGLFAAYMKQTGIAEIGIDISNPTVMAGLFLGSMIPFLFSAMAMESVGRAARKMIVEVRRQFAEIPSLVRALAIYKQYDGDISQASIEEQFEVTAAYEHVEYDRCVRIATEASLREMVFPGVLAVLIPAFIGYAFGALMLGGLIAGVTATGVLMAIFQANAGGAWDNAKKMVEETIEIDGVSHGKGSEIHKAAVVGDTVGDPFKDTSGPALNILIKLMTVVALVIAPSIQVLPFWEKDNFTIEQVIDDTQKAIQEMLGGEQTNEK